jgi:hypothetical protein
MLSCLFNEWLISNTNYPFPDQLLLRNRILSNRKVFKSIETLKTINMKCVNNVYSEQF